MCYEHRPIVISEDSTRNGLATSGQLFGPDWAVLFHFPRNADRYKPARNWSKAYASDRLASVVPLEAQDRMPSICAGEGHNIRGNHLPRSTAANPPLMGNPLAGSRRCRTSRNAHCVMLKIVINNEDSGAAAKLVERNRCTNRK